MKEIESSPIALPENLTTTDTITPVNTQLNVDMDVGADSEGEDALCDSGKNGKSNKSSDILTLDSTYISKGILLKGRNRAVCSSETKNEHKFVLANMILNNINASWSIQVNRRSGWMAFGVCQRDHIRSNNYTFASNSKGFKHGCFLLSSNGYSWNNNIDSENNVMVSQFPGVPVGSTVDLIYSRNTQELEIRVGMNFKIVLTNVTDQTGGYIVPCVIMMTYEDEIAMINGLIMD